MNRLPEFQRVQWVNKKAKDVWEPLLEKVSDTARKAEITSVTEGLRRCALINAKPERLSRVIKHTGLDFRVVDVCGSGDQYSNQVPVYKTGQPFELRTVIGSAKWVSCFVEAWEEKDHAVVGDLLGYPKCCVDNFVKFWAEKKITDLTWHMANLQTNQNRIVVVPWAESFPLWMRMNVRAFYHIPCSYLCYPTYNTAKLYMNQLWDEEVCEIYEQILNWPVEWSALHGAAEIRTPILRIIHDTEWTAAERIIQFVGTSYPDEGVRIKKFPYDLKHNVAYNNGFQTFEGMKLAHESILELVKIPDKVRSVYDPGCGNGYLLNSIGKLRPEASLSGCDINEHAVREGRLLDNNIRIVKENMFDVEYPSADMVVLMPGRLAEVPEDKARAYVSRLNYKYMLLYVYNDHRDQLWDLTDKFFPTNKVLASEINEMTTAVLLEKR